MHPRRLHLHHLVPGTKLCTESRPLVSGLNRWEGKNMEVLLKDGSRLEVGEKASVFDVAEKIGAGLARATLAGEVNG